MERSVTVSGGGPAGASAAIMAALGGSSVDLIEKSRFPRHKVCGEFLSPQIVHELERLGVWRSFEDAGPARIDRLQLRFRAREFGCRLPEPAFGMSRYRFDSLLMNRAAESGARVVRGGIEGKNVVIAHGRDAVSPPASRGRRIFGFKAHFSGPSNDAIELYFFDGGYVGVTAIENGLTNVCGLAPEAALRDVHFQIDDHVVRFPALRERLGPLTRTMDWMQVGPLRFQNRFCAQAIDGQYPAGDALSFVDPFTGSGILAAVMTGALAGECAAQGIPAAEYLGKCRDALGKPFAAASLFRTILGSGWGERLAPFVPASWLYRMTRPRLAS